jgi:hypothetical protein
MINDNVTTGSIAIADRPLGAKKKRKSREFTVTADTFRRFQTGRTKFERWSKYLNLQDDVENSIYNYYKRNNDAVIVLRNEEDGALRAIRPKAANE